MKQLPITFLYQFDHTDDYSRPQIMQEFAANGAKYLVLTDMLLAKMLSERIFAAKLREEMSAAGLEFKDAHAMFGKFLDLNCPVPEARGEMIARHKLALYMIASMGVNTITIHTGNDTVYPEYSLDHQIDCLKKSLDELLPLAEELGIVICIENIWFKINTPEKLLAVKKRFPTDALGFCYDAGHANLMDKGRFNTESNPCKVWQDVTPAWDDHILEKMLPHVVNCHIHDNNGVTDQHRNIGCGNINWDHIVPLLLSAPRLQVIQSEVLPIHANTAIRDICSKFFKTFAQ
ncbi:MAG: sugar phosphate isomerase/epimerase [Lentisphaerae bacterium]|nr:sugar phosphate isomerase/epimerase [Lentisphaerota bacterium]